MSGQATANTPTAREKIMPVAMTERSGLYGFDTGGALTRTLGGRRVIIGKNPYNIAVAAIMIPIATDVPNCPSPGSPAKFNSAKASAVVPADHQIPFAACART